MTTYTMNKNLKKFYVIETYTTTRKKHIVSISEWQKIKSLWENSSPTDKIKIRNWMIQSECIKNIFLSYEHKTDDQPSRDPEWS